MLRRWLGRCVKSSSPFSKRSRRFRPLLEMLEDRSLPNAAPVAQIVGQTSVPAGTLVTLDGSNSFDPDGIITKYEWDFNYDGIAFNVDATGPVVSFNAPQGPQNRVIALRVTDQGGFEGSTNTGSYFGINWQTGKTTSIGSLPGSLGVTEIEIDNSTHRGWLEYGGGSPQFQAHEFNPNTGAGIGANITNNPGRFFTGLAYVGSTLYAAGVASTGGTAPSDLRILDPTTGVSTLVGPTGINAPIAGLAYNSSSGTMYGLLGGMGTTNNFVSINLNTGAATVIGSTGFAGGSLRFGPDGNLYGASSLGQIYQIDPTTGNSTPFTSFGSSAISGLAYDSAVTSSIATANLTISYVAPTVSNVTVTSPINENDFATLSGDIGNPGSASLTLTVNWGEGSPQTYSLAAGATHFSVSHQYLDDNPTNTPSDVYPIAVSLSDGTSTASTNLSVTVNNVAPKLSNVAVTSPINENAFATLTGTITDPGTQDTFKLVVDWGEGSPQTYNLGAGTASFSVTHQYLDDNPTGTASDTYPISLTLTDDDTGSDTANTSVLVKNVAPTLSNVMITPSVTQGDSATLSGTITDPGTQDSFTLVVAWGDSSPQTYSFAAGTTSFSVMHQYVNDVPNGLSSATFPIGLTLKDDDGGTATASTSITVVNPNPNSSSTAQGMVSANTVITGSGMGSGPEIKGFDPTTGALLFDFDAYNPAFQGGVRYALGDVNGDGTPDIITVPGPGGGPLVKVFSGKDLTLILALNAYNPAFQGGLFVAAGDVNGDGTVDIITAPDAGGGPLVNAFNGKDGSILFSFNAYNPAFLGGVRVAVGDTNHDGFSDIITAPGAGGGPLVEVFSGKDASLLFAFNAYNPAFLGGVYVSSGDTNHDGFSDILTGPGAGGGPLVMSYSGKDGSLLLSANVFDSAYRAGVLVGSRDVNADGFADIVASSATGSSPLVQILSGKDGALLLGLIG